MTAPRGPKSPKVVPIRATSKTELLERIDVMRDLVEQDKITSLAFVGEMPDGLAILFWPDPKLPPWSLLGAEIALGEALRDLLRETLGSDE